MSNETLDNAIAKKKNLEIEMLSKTNNISLNEAKEQYKKRNLADNYKKSDFSLEIYEANIVPKILPDYKCKIDLLLTEDLKDSHIIIENNNHFVSDEKLESIKKYIKQNMHEMVDYAIELTNKYITNHGIKENDYKKIIKVKYGRTFVELDGNINGDISLFYDKLVDGIIKIIVSNENKLDKDEIVEIILNKIENMESNTEFSIYSLIKDISNVNGDDLFDITNNVLEGANKKNIKIISKMGENAIAGLPYNIPLIKQ